MAIAVVAGTPVGASGGSNVTSISVSAPALATTDVHIIAATVNATGNSITTPTGYTLLGSTTLSTSTSSSLFVFYRKGSASAATVTLTLSATGRAAAVPFTLTGVDSTTTFDGTASTATSLAAPSKTPGTANEMLITCYGVREGTGPTSGSHNVFSIMPASGMTEIGDVQSTLDNLATNVAAEAAYLSLSGTTATGTKTATTDANAGNIGGSISFLVNAGSVVVTAPSTPTITVVPASTQNTISWSAPNNGGSAITGYTLQRQTYASDGTTVTSAWSTINSPGAAATSYVDTGLINGTIYGYRLSATNSAGTSPYSTEIKGTPAAATGAGTGFIGYLQKTFGSALIHYWPLNDVYQAQDVIGTADGVVHGSITFTSTGASFPGTAGNYISVADRADLSVRNQASKSMALYHGLTVPDWASIGQLRSDGFVHYMGKGQAGQHEYTFRIYPSSDSSRPKRTSCYHYNLDGGLGTGSYVQDATPNGAEQIICACYDLNITTNSAALTYWGSNTGANGFGTSAPGGTFIGKDGAARECDGFTSGGGGTNIIPSDGSAPFTIGCRNDQDSFLKGKIRRVMLFNRKLTPTEVKGIYDNWGLAEGTVGGGSQNTAPTAPQNLSAVRDATDPSLGTVTWSAPSSNGGDAVDGYRVSWTGGTSSFTTSSLVTSPYSLIGLPTSSVTVTVEAHNVNGYGPGATATIAAPTTSLPLIGSMTDNFNGAVDANRVFNTGVSQANGELEWSTVDATHRGTYVRGDFRAQSMFYKITPSTASNTVTAMFVRSTANPALQIRIAYINGTIVGRFDNGSADASPSSKVYSSTTDRYWRIAHSGSTILLQTSSDGNSWTALGRSGFAAPTWLNDVQAGIEAYTSTTI